MRGMKRAKPPSPTIVRRKTRRSLAYLVREGLTPEFKGDYLFPHNLRMSISGKLHDLKLATHGV